MSRSATTFRLPGGQRVRTQTQRSFVLIALSVNLSPGEAWIEMRSDSMVALRERLRREQNKGRLVITPVWIGVTGTGTLHPQNRLAREASGS